jgi:hypothetical protein
MNERKIKLEKRIKHKTINNKLEYKISGKEKKQTKLPKKSNSRKNLVGGYMLLSFLTT